MPLLAALHVALAHDPVRGPSEDRPVRFSPAAAGSAPHPVEGGWQDAPVPVDLEGRRVVALLPEAGMAAPALDVEIGLARHGMNIARTWRVGKAERGVLSCCDSGRRR
jgi:hypothetical protein